MEEFGYNVPNYISSVDKDTVYGRRRDPRTPSRTFAFVKTDAMHLLFRKLGRGLAPLGTPLACCMLLNQRKILDK